MHWVNEVNFWVFFRKILHSSHHTDETITKVLTSVTGNKDKLLTISQTSYIITGIKKDCILLLSNCFIVLQLIHNVVKSSNTCISVIWQLCMKKEYRSFRK